MPRIKNSAKIGIHELHFTGFELPMEHEKSITNAVSIKGIEVEPVEYHIVKTYDPKLGLTYKAILPLTGKNKLKKEFEKLKSLFEDTGVDYAFAEEENTLYLILTIPEDSELIRFIKKVEEKVKEFEKISTNDVFHVGVAKDEIYIDKTSNAPIIVKRSYIPNTSELVAFVLNNLEMPKFWFKVHEYAIILDDFDAFSLRFLYVERKKERIESNRIIVSYAIPSNDDPVSEVIKMRVEEDIELLKKMDASYREQTRRWVERIVEKYTPEMKAEVMSIIDEALEKKALKVITSKEYATKFYIEVITPDGRLYSEDFIPEFVMRKIVKTYYDNILFQLVRIYIERAKELLSAIPLHREVEEEKKKGFLDGLLKKLKKSDEEEVESKEPPSSEVDAYLEAVKEYAEER